MSLTLKIRALVICLVAISAAIVGWVVSWSHRAVAESARRADLTALTAADARTLEFALQQVQLDLQVLVRLPSVLDLSNGSEEGAGRARLTDRLAAVFTAEADAKPPYQQIRLIGVADGGREIVRVERDRGEVRRTAEADLQQKGGRDYFLAALALAPGELYVSDVNLNVEHGAIEVPHRPMLRVAQAVRRPDGEASAVLVINVQFEEFVQRLLRLDDPRYACYLTNQAGDFLIHPDRRQTYGFDLGRRHLVQEKKAGLEALLGGDVDLAEAVDGATFVRVHAYPEGDPRSFLLGLEDRSLAVAPALRAIAVRSAWIAGTLFLLVLGASYAFAARISRPIRDLTEAADRVTAGGALERLPVERGDELGVLARALTRMVQSLRGRERELSSSQLRLAEANRDLEHFSHLASHDLREPARRIVALADLVLEEEGERVSSNGRALLQHLQTSAEGLLAQIAEFRALAGIGKGLGGRSSVDLGPVIDAALAEKSDVLDRRRVQVVRGEAPCLDAYPDLARALYGSLIENVLDHVKGDGFELDFTCERRADGVSILGVRNNGSTIAPERAERAFDALRRMDGGRGGGMGLAVCKRIVQRHAGRIWIETLPNEVHVRFTLSEPRSPEVPL